MFTYCTMIYVVCVLYRLEGRRPADLQREDGWLNVSHPLLGLSEEAAEKAGQRNWFKTTSPKTPISRSPTFCLQNNPITQKEFIFITICIQIFILPLYQQLIIQYWYEYPVLKVNQNTNKRVCLPEEESTAAQNIIYLMFMQATTTVYLV